jgi:3-phenylpropionate/trans-cinnamate dioxygenase ferredoxin reductase component
MPSYRYLIVGGGMTADAAIGGVREHDRHGTIGLVGAEPQPPYNRPPLTKGLWKNLPLEKIWRSHAVDEAVLHLGRVAVRLDPAARTVTDDQGTTYHYEKLLLATGGRPRTLPGGSSAITYFRTVDDYHHVRMLAQQRRRFVVIGGGFIGSEIAAALAGNGNQVTMIFPEESIGGRMFPPALARFLTEFYRQKGVEVLAGARDVAVTSRDGKFRVTARLADDQPPRELVPDVVVAGLGIEPNVELARQAGLEVANGIRVDAALRTSQREIYAAGDVAEFHNPALGAWLRVEHEDNANTMGALAGRSMAGEAVSYDHLPFFYSDLFELGYEAVGELDARLPTTVDWKEPYREGVVYYLRDGQIRGVLLWNVWERVDAARRLIAEHHRFEPGELKLDLLNARQPA